MNPEKTIQAISNRLIENTGKLRYGTVSVTLKIHEGNVVAIPHETTECRREREVLNETV